VPPYAFLEMQPHNALNSHIAMLYAELPFLDSMRCRQLARVHGIKIICDHTHSHQQQLNARQKAQGTLTPPQSLGMFLSAAWNPHLHQGQSLPTLHACPAHPPWARPKQGCRCASRSWRHHLHPTALQSRSSSSFSCWTLLMGPRIADEWCR
jgi:hypothetical protein